MECGVQSAMLSVPPGTSEPGVQPASLPTAVFAPLTQIKPNSKLTNEPCTSNKNHKTYFKSHKYIKCNVCCYIFFYLSVSSFSRFRHPLFPLLALLFERCELATQSSDPQSSDAFNLDIQAFVQHQERDRKPFLANEPEIDGLV